MTIQKEECGCYVAKHNDRSGQLEIHGTSFADVIERMFAVIRGMQLDPRNIPL